MKKHFVRFAGLLVLAVFVGGALALPNSAVAQGRQPPTPLPTQSHGCNGVGNHHCPADPTAVPTNVPPTTVPTTQPGVNPTPSKEPGTTKIESAVAQGSCGECCCNLQRVDIMSIQGFTFGTTYTVAINSQEWKVAVYKGSAKDNMLTTTADICDPFVANPILGQTITLKVLTPDGVTEVVEISVK